MNPRLTDDDVRELIGGDPQFDAAPGPASRALLARHILSRLGESVDRETVMAITLLAGGMPPALSDAASELARFNGLGVTEKELQRMAAKEVAKG